MSFESCPINSQLIVSPVRASEVFFEGVWDLLVDLSEGEKLEFDLVKIHSFLCVNGDLVDLFEKNIDKINLKIGESFIDKEYFDSYFRYIGALVLFYDDMISCLPEDELGVRILIKEMYNFMKSNNLWVGLNKDMYLIILNNIYLAFSSLDISIIGESKLRGMFDKTFEMLRLFEGEVDFDELASMFVSLEKEAFPADYILRSCEDLKKLKIKEGGLNYKVKSQGMIFLKTVCDNLYNCLVTNNAFKNDLRSILEIFELLETDKNADFLKRFLFNLVHACEELLNEDSSKDVVESYLTLLAIICSMFFGTDELRVIGLVDRNINLISSVDINGDELDYLTLEVKERYRINLHYYSILKMTRSHVNEILSRWS